MVEARHASRGVTALIVLLGLGATGCSHVKQDEFRSEVEKIREEMRAGDQALDRRLSSRMDAMESRMAMVEEELRTMEEEFGAEVARLERALRVHAPVHSGFDEAHLEEDQIPVLGRLGAVLQEHYPRALVTVEGFTDPAGSPGYNQRLGLHRAESVRNYLVDEVGLAPGQVRTVSYGEAPGRLVRPDAQGPGREGRVNRRAVLVIDHPGAWETGPVVTQGGTG